MYYINAKPDLHLRSVFLADRFGQSICHRAGHTKCGTARNGVRAPENG